MTAPSRAPVPEGRAALTARAVTASVAVAAVHGLPVDDPCVLAGGCAVRVYPRPAPVAARVSTLTALLRTPIERAGHRLAASDVAWLRDAYDRLLPRLRAPAGPLQPLHGDAHAYNFIPTADGLLWNDFEDTCKGPIAWDPSSMIDDGGKVAAAYPNAPDSTTLEFYRRARRLHATVWVHALLPEVPAWAELASGTLADLCRYV